MRSERWVAGSQPRWRGSRWRGSVRRGGVEGGCAGRTGRVGAGRPAEAARGGARAANGVTGPGGSPAAGTGPGWPPDSARAAHTTCLGRPGQLDREARAAQLLQVGLRDVPSVGEAVDELGTTEVDGVRSGGGSGPARRPACQPLFMLCPSTNSKDGWPRRPRPSVLSMWRRRRGDGRGRAGLGRRQPGVPSAVGTAAGRGRPRRPSPARAGRGSIPCRSAARRAGRVVPGHGLDHVRARPEGDPLGVGPAGHDLRLAAVRARAAPTRRRHRDRLAVDGEQVGDAVAREGRRHRGRRDARGCRSRRSRAAGPGARPSSSCRRTRAAPR